MLLWWQQEMDEYTDLSTHTERGGRRNYVTRIVEQEEGQGTGSNSTAPNDERSDGQYGGDCNENCV